MGKNRFSGALVVVALVTMVATELVKYWVKQAFEGISWGWHIVIAVAAVVLILFYRSDRVRRWLREERQFWHLRRTGSDILRQNEFIEVLRRYLRKLSEHTWLTFYNIPLATLENDWQRRALWEKAIGGNGYIEQFRLVLDAERYDTLLEYYKKIPDEGRRRLANKTSVVVLTFPNEEILNFACVVEDAVNERPLFASASIEAPPFWVRAGVEGTEGDSAEGGQGSFTHLFAFNARKPDTENVCDSIGTHVKKVWKLATDGNAELTLHGRVSAVATVVRVVSSAELVGLVCVREEKRPAR